MRNVARRHLLDHVETVDRHPCPAVRHPFSALYKARLFEVVDGRMAPNWIFSATEHGFYFEPAARTRPGHWDDLFCNDRAAVERAWSDHRAERDLILAHAGRQPGREGSIGKICGPPDQTPHT